MGKLGLLSVLGVLALIVGCGSSTTGSNDNDAGTGGTGGVGATKGTGGTGTVGGSGSTEPCNIPSCLADLMNNCAPSGTCVDQLDTTTFADNVCFSNGIKIITTVDTTTSVIVMTYKNGSSTCYTVELSGTTTSETIAVKNPSGSVVATGTGDTTSTTFTCTGGQPVTLNPNCDSTALTGDTSNCTAGTCTP